MSAFFYVIYVLLDFLQFMMMLYGIVSLLVFFGVLKPYGRFTQLVWLNMQGLFEPLLAPLRRFIPPVRGFDWSFLVLYLLTVFTQRVIVDYGLLAPRAAQGITP